METDEPRRAAVRVLAFNCNRFFCGLTTVRFNYARLLSRRQSAARSIPKEEPVVRGVRIPARSGIGPRSPEGAENKKRGEEERTSLLSPRHNWGRKARIAIKPPFITIPRLEGRKRADLPLETSTRVSRRNDRLLSQIDAIEALIPIRTTVPRNFIWRISDICLEQGVNPDAESRGAELLPLNRSSEDPNAGLSERLGIEEEPKVKVKGRTAMAKEREEKDALHEGASPRLPKEPNEDDAREIRSVNGRLLITLEVGKELDPEEESKLLHRRVLPSSLSAMAQARRTSSRRPLSSTVAQHSGFALGFRASGSPFLSTSSRPKALSRLVCGHFVAEESRRMEVSRVACLNIPATGSQTTQLGRTEFRWPIISEPVRAYFRSVALKSLDGTETKSGRRNGGICGIPRIPKHALIALWGYPITNLIEDI
ncbi:hypothetical protein KM043_009485 [Ampulex compressa]|nr:hypothetical protein KM043_009485 [Ampulex compressa]